MPTTANAANDDQSRAVDTVQIAGHEMTVTGQFLHGTQHKQILSYQTAGDAQRSFTILIAMAKRDLVGVDFNSNGIVVLDNDNLAVLLDEFSPQSSGIGGPSPRQLKNLDALAGLDWHGFVQFMSKTNYSRGIATDIDQRLDMPVNGNFDTQVLLGLKQPDDRDFRDSFVRAIHADGLYDMPATSRMNMINNILMHPTERTRDGLALSWGIKMNFPWDKSGVSEEGFETDPEYDKRWIREMESRGELFMEVCEDALAPYLEEGFAALELEDAHAELQTFGTGDDRLILKSFRGQDFTMPSIRDLRITLESMKDDDLRNLWTTIRVLDQDLSRAQRGIEMSLSANKIRAEVEREWSLEVDSELIF